jgi:hypothetical protein
MLNAEKYATHGGRQAPAVSLECVRLLGSIGELNDGDFCFI